MKKVNDFLSYECFVIKDMKHDCKPIDLQINVFGETHLSDKYGNRDVIGYRYEKGRDIWGKDCLCPDDKTMVLYI